MKAETAQTWLEIATGPLGGAVVAGFVIGALMGIYLWEKYVVRPKITQHMEACEVQLAAQQKEIDRMIPIVNRWEALMEGTAYKTLGISTLRNPNG